jgi:hypothetical protein
LALMRGLQGAARRILAARLKIMRWVKSPFCVMRSLAYCDALDEIC